MNLPAERAEITRAIATLWPAWKPSPGMLALWDELLADIETSEARAAVLLHATESTFPPTIADLRRIALTERGVPASQFKALARRLLRLPDPEQRRFELEKKAKADRELFEERMRVECRIAARAVLEEREESERT